MGNLPLIGKKYVKLITFYLFWKSLSKIYSLREFVNNAEKMIWNRSERGNMNEIIFEGITKKIRVLSKSPN
jgi:hypothetical protein